MIVIENGAAQARDPTVGEYKNHPVIHHKEVMNGLQAAFRLLFGNSPELQAHTTPDGLDYVIWGELGRTTLRRHSQMGFLTVAMVVSNTRRQRTAFYGGLSGDGWNVVFDRYVLRGKSRLKPENVMRATEDCVGRWSLFTDYYTEKLKQIRDMELHASKYNWLLLEAAREGLLSWSRLGNFDRTRPTHMDTGLEFLKRFSVAVAKQPPISHEPARCQPWSLHRAYRLLFEI